MTSRQRRRLSRAIWWTKRMRPIVEKALQSCPVPSADDKARCAESVSVVTPKGGENTGAASIVAGHSLSGGKGVEVAPAGPVDRTTCEFGGGVLSASETQGPTVLQPDEAHKYCTAGSLCGRTESDHSTGILPAANSDLNAIREDLRPYAEKFWNAQGRDQKHGGQIAV